MLNTLCPPQLITPIRKYVCIRPVADGTAVPFLQLPDPPRIVPPSAIRSAACFCAVIVDFLLEAPSTSVIEASIYSSVSSAIATLVPL